ncbi:AMP-binding protein [Solwaraspora sp. WMMD792]|uniref:AMP-binding protein n=1 Tax=Solwaraspora sp. WMMD792 TaxID=3016099 RepID=UPI002417A866|nr:AMP-binding protein [Solwaraspora sp. WMMD792]MDG4771141.1 AMP-binding protein [Solwaraspora sp. WMMD792]
MASERVQASDGTAASTRVAPTVATYRTSCVGARTSIDEAQAVVFGALAALETAARLDRPVPIRSTTTTLGLDLVDPPEQLRHLAGPAVRSWLSRRLRPVDLLPERRDTLLVRATTGVAAPPGPPTARIDWRVTANHLTIHASCPGGDPWRRCLPAVAELYAEVLRELVDEPGQASWRTAGISGTSRDLLLDRYAGRRVDRGPFRPLHLLVEQAVDRHPQRVAVSGAGGRLTYRELDDAANGLAATLAEVGVRPGDPVPVLLAAGPALPVASLALLKIGAVHVTVDPRWSPARLRSVLASVPGAPVLAAAPSGDPVLSGARVIDVRPGQVPSSRRRPEPAGTPDDLAHALVTADADGVPRCTVSRHVALTDRVHFMTRFFAATGGEVVLPGGPGPAPSVGNLIWPLTTGGRLVLASPVSGRPDLSTMVAVVAAEQVTMIDTEPDTLDAMVAAIERDAAVAGRLASLRHVVVPGPGLRPASARRLRRLLPQVEVSTGYGPVGTAAVAYHRVGETDGDAIPVGQPVDNCHLLVADDRLRLLPPGATGAILIGGAGVGAGRHGTPWRAAAGYVANPFPEIPGELLYRSGDLGRFDEDGRLHLVGRGDRRTDGDETPERSGATRVAEPEPDVRLRGENRVVVAASAGVAGRGGGPGPG